MSSFREDAEAEKHYAWAVSAIEYLEAHHGYTPTNIVDYLERMIEDRTFALRLYFEASQEPVKLEYDKKTGEVH